MSRNLTNSNALTNPVTTGAQVVAQMFTTTGFNAGDYVYQMTGGAVGTRQTGNLGLGADYAWVSGQLYTGYLQNANFRTASYGPFLDQATYSGTTITAGNATISATAINSVIGTSSFKQSATLSNGNVVLVYSDSTSSGATLYFKIVSNTGATVLAETTAVSGGSYNTASSCCFSVCGVNTGQFVITYMSSTGTNTILTKSYTNAGVFVQNVTLSIPTGTGYGHQSAGLANGGVVISYVDAPGVGQVYTTLMVPGGGSASRFITHQCNSNSAPVVGLPTSLLASGTNYGAYAIYTPDNAGTSNTMYVSVYNNNSEVAYSSLYSTYNFTRYQTTSITVLSDNTIALLAPYGYLEKYTLSGSSLTRSIAFFTGTISGVYSGYVIPSANGGCVIAGTGSSYTNLLAIALSSANVGTAISTNYVNIYNPGNTNPQSYSIAGLAIGSFMSFYPASASPYYPTIIGTANQTATNGVTVFTGTNSYTPTNGYILQGVAVSNASANSVGQVVVNGVAQLGSTYPTVTSPINFNYQNTGGQFAQKGAMSSTTVILKGLE